MNCWSITSIVDPPGDLHRGEGQVQSASSAAARADTSYTGTSSLSSVDIGWKRVMRYLRGKMIVRRRCLANVELRSDAAQASSHRIRCVDNGRTRELKLNANVRIHRASIDELTAVRQIVDEYCDAIGVLVRDDRSALEQYFERQSGIWLAAHEETVVGCVILRPLPARTDSCEVKRLYVKEPYRGLGTADALMDALEGYAVSAGYRTAYLDTKDDLHAAVRFYERRGYGACERYNDNPQASIFMRRELR